MNRLLLTAAVLVLAARQRWHESKWNPWGGTDSSAPKPPVQ